MTTTATSCHYLIKSTPYLNKNGYEFELYVYISSELGRKSAESLDVIYSNENSTTPEGFILVIDRDNGKVVEVGTEQSPLPVELLEQMKTKRGLAVYETGDNDKINAIYTLHQA